YFTLNVLNQDIMTARTTALMTLIFFEIANAFNFRSFRYPVFSSSPFANKYLVYAAIASIFASFLIVYSPLNVAFETAPIGWFNMILGVLLSLSVIIIFDLLKMRNRKEELN
ncbi:cation transporting ATPase C-terminal domain-containing protein, partial [bacterium]|nr:cation transporting ATPase C-terminal domain-containing protein [bacterium]